jgi:hypothetical protein
MWFNKDTLSHNRAVRARTAPCRPGDAENVGVVRQNTAVSIELGRSGATRRHLRPPSESPSPLNVRRGDLDPIVVHVRTSKRGVKRTQLQFHQLCLISPDSRKGNYPWSYGAISHGTHGAFRLRSFLAYKKVHARSVTARAEKTSKKSCMHCKMVSP